MDITKFIDEFQIENPPEPPDSYGGRTSPYDNVTSVRQTPTRRSAPRKRPAHLPLFIGNSTNIDDLLGDIIGPGHSPMMPRSRKKFSGGKDESRFWLISHESHFIHTIHDRKFDF